MVGTAVGNETRRAGRGGSGSSHLILTPKRFRCRAGWRKYFVSAGHNEVHTDPALTVSANQMRLRAGFGDPNHRGWNAAGEVIYDYRKAVVQYTTEQVTYNTDCCGISAQFHRFNLVGLRNENQFRVAFSVANIATTLTT